MKRDVRVYGLENWGLTLKALASLGDAAVRLQAYLRHPVERRLFALPPARRREAIRATRLRHYEALARWWPSREFERIGGRASPVGIRGVLPARLVEHLRRLPVRDISLDDVPGLRRRRVKAGRAWFAVQARFAIQVEGQTRGMQKYEDRIVLVRAISPEDAAARLSGEFRRYGEPYLNNHGYMVRWAFERVLDVCEVMDAEFSPRGTEVFSQLRRRRIRPEYVARAWSARPAGRGVAEARRQLRRSR